MQRVVPTSCADCQLYLRESGSTTYSVSSITASLKQIDAYLTAYSVLRGDSAELVIVCLWVLEVYQGLSGRMSGRCKRDEKAY